MTALGLALLLAGAVIPRDLEWTGPEGSAGTAEPSSHGRAGLLGATRPSPAETGVPPAGTRDDRPYKSPPREPLDFRGPGRDEPEPDVDEVVLGWFGPGDPDHPEFGDYLRGAVLAVEQENACGGYRGKPFRLEPAWSESPWMAGIVDVTRLVYERGAWAVIGGVDGATTHLAVQLALKSHFLLLSPGSTDVTTDQANVSWLFSLPPSDEPVCLAVAEAVSETTSGGPFAVLASTDHDAHAALVALRRALGARRLTPAALVEVDPLESDLSTLARRLLQTSPRVVVLLAPSRLGGRLVAVLRGAGFRGTIVGGASASRAAFRRAAGAAAEGVLAPILVEPGPEGGAFARCYGERWAAPPDEAAAHGYDAVRLVVAAVRRAGLNRPLVRDAVRALAPWSGVSGTVRWDALGRNQRDVRIGAWTGERLVPTIR